MAARQWWGGIRWYWLPAVAAYAVVLWLADGPLIAVLGVIAGLALGFWLNYRAAGRRGGDTPPESD